jgi:RimJ/RimL family protein N-acetyltransferase
MKLYNTDRLNVCQVTNPSDISVAVLPGILTASVTKELPAHWQPVMDQQSSLNWIAERLSEGKLYSVNELASGCLIGFLFLHELSINEELDFKSRNLSKNLSQVHIGYLLSENYWRRGFASELIDGLVKFYQQSNKVLRLVGGVERANVGSSKILEKSGFKIFESRDETVFYHYQFERL